MRRITVLITVFALLLSTFCLHPLGAEGLGPASRREEAEAGPAALESGERQTESPGEPLPEQSESATDETLPDEKTASEEQTEPAQETDPDTTKEPVPTAQEETEPEMTESSESENTTREEETGLPGESSLTPEHEETESSREKNGSEEETLPGGEETLPEEETLSEDETEESEEETGEVMLRAAKAGGITVVIHSNGGRWYKPVKGEPAGTLGEPAGSGTNRTFTRTIGAGESFVLHNTDAALPDNYYRYGGTVEETKRWLTWFTRDGYVFQGWNTLAKSGSAPTSHYSGWNVLDAGKMYTISNGPTTAASNNFGQSVNLSMDTLGVSSGATVHLYAQWRKRYGINTSTNLSGGSGLRISTEGFEKGSSLYNGLELMIPLDQKDVAKKIQTGGNPDFVWKTDTGKGRFYLKKALAKNAAYTSSQSLWVLLKDRAYDIYGQTYDVKITLSNIKITASQSVDAGSANIFGVNMSSGKAECSVYPNHTGASYTVRVQILKSGTNTEVKGKRTMILLRDLDIPDRLVGSANYQYRWNNGASSPKEQVPENGIVSAIYPYAEAVSIPSSAVAAAATSAAAKQIYVQSDNSVVAAPAASSVRVTGSEYTGSQSSSYGQVLQRDSYADAVAFPVLTGNIVFTWTGNTCGTTLFEKGEANNITSYVVEANGKTLVNGGAGSSTEGGIITFGGAGAHAYPYNGSAVYTVTPAAGYKTAGVWLDFGTDRAKKLTLDGQEHTVSGGGTYRISENGGSFTFVGIVDNHDIRVAFAKDEIKTGTLTVEKTVQGAMGSRDAVFHFTVKLSHAQGYDSYPGGKISCRINGGAENLLALSPVSGSAGTASVSFTLTHGDTMTLYGLWDGTSYEVTEAEADQNGYETRCDAPEGTVAADQNVSVQVINKKDLAVPTGILLPGGLPALFAGAAGVTGLLLSKRQRRR